MEREAAAWPWPCRWLPSQRGSLSRLLRRDDPRLCRSVLSALESGLKLKGGVFTSSRLGRSPSILRLSLPRRATRLRRLISRQQGH